ncbi:MAG: SDR family NAD(P)-dependent oxidoreductase [Thermoplasmatota archaeon]
MCANVLVTGGAGFIGSHLVDELARRGHFVRVLDNLSRGRLRHIQPLIDAGKVEFMDGDIRYMDAVNRAMAGVEYVFHEAAICINRSQTHPQEAIDINLNGSHNVFKAALDQKVRKVLFASSASVYGEPKRLPMAESHELNPLTPYCVSKIACEYLLRFFARQGLRHISFRYFNVYGLRQSTDAYYTSVIILFIKRILAGQSPQIMGDGSQTMDFVNVRDIVQANVLGMESEVSNEVFNVATGTQTSVRDLAHILLESLNRKGIQPEFLPRNVLVKNREADISKIQAMLGYRVSVDAKTGLAEVARDIIAHPEDY